MKLILIVILSLFIYIKCDKNCKDISPKDSLDCMLSEQDMNNSPYFKYCCYHKFMKVYEKNDGTRTYSFSEKCFPYNYTEYNKVKTSLFDTQSYYDSYYYDSYGELQEFICNNRSIVEIEKVKANETICNNIIPSSINDCKMSHTESKEYFNHSCCYVQDYTHILPYCKRYTQSEINTRAKNINSTTSPIIFVCHSGSFLNVSFFIILILLL